MDGDPFFLELLLNDVALVGLLDAARSLEGVDFLHGGTQAMTRFRFALAEPQLRACIEWASTCDLGDAREAIGVEQLAALRAWTCTPLCYALCHVMRSPDRTLASVAPALSFCRLLFTAMRGIPQKYIFNDGILYRAERGVMRTWDAKMREGGIFSFYVPTSFSRDPAVLARFRGEGSRTVFILRGAAGIKLDEISPYDEKEVLLEPVCHFEVLLSEKFDASHRDVQMGEVTEGLHRVEGHVRPGIALLEGSQLKAVEEASYRNWQQQQHTHQQQQHPVVPELEFDPFSEQELLAMNKPVPKSKTIHRMSKIGGGAFGTTYRKRVRHGAVHSGVSRFAVKVISADRMEDMLIEADDVRREATILGLLRHKHVIRYVGLIETDEELALVMELAEGGSLADLITITKTSASGQGVQMGEVLEMTGQMGSALDYVHGQGIVHRDVKADNILLAHTNGAGPLCVKLADFGMAAVLATAAGSNLSSKGGTSHYFSPERGKDKAYGAKADMWALGCVLIELVTLTRLQRGLWNDDTEVVERRNHLLGQVKLRNESMGKLVEGLLQMEKSCRLSALGLKAACSALVSAHTASHGRASSGQVPLVGDFDVVFDLADLSQKLTERGVNDTLGEIHDLWQERAGGDLEALDHLQQLHACLGRHLVVLKKPPMDMRKTLVQLASQEPVGTRLLREAEAALQGLQQEVIEWVNKPSAPLPCVMDIREHSGSVLSVAVSPDWIASGSRDKTVKVVERRTGQVKCTLSGHSEDNPNCTCTFRTWGFFEEANPNCPVRGHSGSVRGVCFSPDGSKLASCSGDRSVKIWNSSECVSTLSGHSKHNPHCTCTHSDESPWYTANPTCPVSGHSERVTSVAWSPDGASLASGSQGEVKVWNAKTGKCQSTMTWPVDHDSYRCWVSSVTWSPDGKNLASGSDDKTIKVWNAQTGQCVSTLTGHTGRVNSVCFSPCGTKIVSGGGWPRDYKGNGDFSIRIWDAEMGTQIGSPLKGHSDCVSSVAWSPDGTTLVSGSWDKTTKVWNAKTGKCQSTLHQGMENSGGVNSVTWSPGGKYLASAGNDKTVRIWDGSPGQWQSPLTVDSEVTSVAFSADGSKIAAAYDKEIQLFDAQTQAKLGSPLTGHSDSVFSVAWTPDGTRIGSGSYDKTIKVWNAQTGQCLSTCGHSHYVRAFSWSPDGTMLASGSDDKTIKLWDAQRGKVNSTLRGHREPVTQVEFAHDGATLVSCDDGGTTCRPTTRYWDVQSGEAWDEVKSVLEGSMFTFSKRTREQQVGKFLITAEGDILRIFKSESGVKDKADKDNAPVAFFRAPVPISTVDTSGEHIAVGCENGKLLLLRAAVPLTG